MFKDNDEEYIKQEKEANALALAILMPKEMFLKELNKTKMDLSNDDLLMKKLAKKFQVSQTAVVFRMVMLKECIL